MRSATTSSKNTSHGSTPPTTASTVPAKCGWRSTARASKWRLYKTELIKPRKPRRTVEEVELATAEWVDYFNNRRFYQYRGDVPPVELEAAYYAQRQRPAAG